MCVRVHACIYGLWVDCDSSVIKTYDGRGAGNRLGGSQVAAAVNLRLLPVSVCACVHLCALLFVIHAHTLASMYSMCVCSFMCDPYTFHQQAATAALQTGPCLSAQPAEGRHSENR